MKNSADLGGCYPPRPSSSVDLQNSSYPTQPHSIIAKNAHVLQGRQTKDGRWKTWGRTVQRTRQKEKKIQKPFQKKTKNKRRENRSLARKLALRLAFVKMFNKCIIWRIHISSDQKRQRKYILRIMFKYIKMIIIHICLSRSHFNLRLLIFLAWHAGFSCYWEMYLFEDFRFFPF